MDFNEHRDPFGCVKTEEDNDDFFAPMGLSWGRESLPSDSGPMALLATVAVVGVIGLAFSLLSKK